MDELKAPGAPINAPEQGLASTPSKPESDPRMDALARRERALRAQARQLQKEKQKMEQERAKLLDPESWKKKFLEDPTTVGLTYEEIASRYLQQPSPEEQRIQALQRKLEELEAKQSETVSKVTSAQEQAYQQAVKQLTREVSLLVDGNDAFETIRATESQDAVVALIEQTYKEDGILMTAEEAAKQVEEYLLEQALSLAKLNKVKAKLAPPEPTPAEAKEATPQAQKPPIQTLTRAVIQPQSGPLTAKQKRERAIAAFYGKQVG